MGRTLHKASLVRDNTLGRLLGRYVVPETRMENVYCFVLMYLHTYLLYYVGRYKMRTTALVLVKAST